MSETPAKTPAIDPFAKYDKPPAAAVDEGSGGVDPFAKYDKAPPNAAATTEGATPPPDYANMPWSEVGEHAVTNLPSSAWSSIKSIPSAFYNYKDTINALGQAAYGAGSKTGLIGPQDPESKAKNEAVTNALIEPYTSIAGFKKALAEDPFSVLTTASMFLDPPAGLAGKGAELLSEAGKLGTLARVGARTLKGIETVTDPTKMATTALDVGSTLAGKAITGVQHVATGVPQTALETAASAGKASAMGQSDLANAFNKFAKGEGDPVDLSRKVHDAIQGMKTDAYAQWKQGKGALINSSSAPIDIAPALKAIQDERARLPGLNVAGPPAQYAHQALNDAEGMLWDRVLSGNPADLSLEGMDQLKQELHEMYVGQFKGQMAENALKGVHAGVRQSLSNASPEYDALMSGYQRMLDDMQNITKSAGASDKTAASTELQRLVSKQKTPDGRDIIERLGERDPTIPYALAGAGVHNAMAQGVAGWAEHGGGLFHAYNIAHALMSGDRGYLATALGMPLLQGTVQSPRLMGGTNYVAGYLSGKAQPLTNTIGRAGNLAMTPGVVPAATNLARAQDEVTQQPQGYAAGGSVDKPHRHLVERLNRLTEMAKKAEKERTKPLLKVPDDAIAGALAVAQKGV